MKLTLKIVAATAMMMAAGASFAQKGETVKMVRIDPLTGLLGPVGVSQIKGYQFFAEKFSGAGNPAGVKFEVTPIDNKLSPAESLNALKAAIDQGARYIIQGNGSSVALALSDAVEKHNARNPGKEVMYLNDSAVDPDLTNGKCSYWHFRFDADTSMKMEAMSWRANARTSRWWARTCTRWHRRVTLPRTSPRSRRRALTR
jgi:branched-chain amino acid transport system substrate-binding protein